MFCKKLLALFFWCHCYQVVLNPLLQLIAVGLNTQENLLALNTLSKHHHQDQSNYYESGSFKALAEANINSISNGIASSRSSISSSNSKVSGSSESNSNFISHINQNGNEANKNKNNNKNNDDNIKSSSSRFYRHSPSPSSSSSFFSSLFVAASPITVESNQVALTPGHEILLRCSIAEYPDEQFNWFRIKLYSSKETPPIDGTINEEELKPTDERFIIKNNEIVIKSPSFNDIGDYYCRVKQPRDGMETEKMISVRAKPYIFEFDLESSTFRSATIEEGKSLKLICNVIDDYTPESKIKITWQMSKYDENDMNDVISGEDGIRLESYNSTSNALIIDRVTKDHRKFYKCQASNGITDNTKVILIRVKDKYTVIWPTVGIVIELVILIGVIIIVENRKVEPDKDTYDRKAIQM